MSCSLRNLSGILGISHPLLAVEIVNHFHRCAHVGCQLKYVDAFRYPHGRVGVPERIGHSSLPSDPNRTPASFKTRLDPTLKLPIGAPSRPQKGCSVSDATRPFLAVRNDF